MPPPSPRYGSASLADLLPSVLAALGVPGEQAVLDVALERPLVCLLLVDGLGADLLAEHAAHAPFLAGLHDRARDLDCGFPSTTATSLGSLGVGRPPGVHGLAGYTVRVPETGAVLNHLRWDQPIDAERWQPYSTAFERAAAAGVAVTRIGPWSFHGTGLTTAALRGGDYRGADALGERIIEAGRALETPGPALAYVYEGDLDSVGHRQAPGSAAWLQQLALTDGFAARVAEALPAGATLLVTGDHGMVTVPEDARVDLDANPALREGVEALASEPRARYVHTRPGAAEDVRAAWAGTLGDRAWVVLRDEAIEAGWYGPEVVDAVRPRLGDVIAVARGQHALVSLSVEPFAPLLKGMHGSLEASDQRIPLLSVRA
jgi:predicted AlkP superfamily pyrophosphatase or phosphodiesterase